MTFPFDKMMKLAQQQEIDPPKLYVSEYMREAIKVIVQARNRHERRSGYAKLRENHRRKKKHAG